MSADEKRAALRAAGWTRSQRAQTGEWWVPPLHAEPRHPIRLDSAWKRHRRTP